MYNLEPAARYNDQIVSYKLSDFLDEITTNERLKAVLIGSNFLYVANKEKTPLYVHALTVNSYIQSAWRCINGGGQISKLLLAELKKYGGEIYKNTTVVSFECDGEKITSCTTKEGKIFEGEQFISNMNLKETIRMVGPNHFSKPFVKRIMSLEEVTSVFSLYIVFKKNQFPYYNNNIYHYKQMEDIWDTNGKCTKDWPNLVVASMNANRLEQTFADSMTAMTYMDFSEVEEWQHTYNVSTIKNLKQREDAYEQFKAEKTELLLQELEKIYPNIRSAIQGMYTSTPLTYRDFIGSEKGNMYGFIKDANSPMKTFISPRSKIGNLFFSGQNVRMHGIMGVTIGAFVTCMEMIDREVLTQKLNQYRDDTAHT